MLLVVMCGVATMLPGCATLLWQAHRLQILIIVSSGHQSLSLSKTVNKQSSPDNPQA